MGVIIGVYSRREDAPNYDNIVAYQEKRDDFLYNVELSLGAEHAIVKCAGKDPQVFMNGRSDVFNPNGWIIWPFRKVDKRKYQITYINAREQTGRLTIKLTKEREIPVEYKYKIKDPTTLIGTIGPDESYNRYQTWTSNRLQKEINKTIETLVSSEMSGLLESTNLNQMADYLSWSIVDEIKYRGILKRLGVSLTSLSFDQKTLAEISQTLAESKTDKESVETRDQVIKALEKGFNDIKNQNIELTEGTRAHVSAVGEGINAHTDEKTEENKLHTSKEIENLKAFFIKERDAFVPKILDTIKNGQDLIIEDIKKYFDITNETVTAEIKRISDKIESKQPLTKEEYVQIAETIAHSDPKDLKNTPQLTLNYILDKIEEDWHASMAADAIYHQLEKWFSSKKYEDGENMNLCNTSFESLKKLVATYPEALNEVPYKEYNPKTHKKDLSGRLFKDLTKSPEGVKYKDKTLEEWVNKERIDKERNKNLKSRVDVSGGIKCYFAVADKAKKSNKVKEYMSVCYDVGQFWTKTNYIRHFGPNEDKLKRKAYEVGYTLETPQNRKKYLLAFCKLLTTGLLKEENILPIYQEQ